MSRMACGRPAQLAARAATNARPRRHCAFKGVLLKIFYIHVLFTAPAMKSARSRSSRPTGIYSCWRLARFACTVLCLERGAVFLAAQLQQHQRHGVQRQACSVIRLQFLCDIMGQRRGRPFSVTIILWPHQTTTAGSSSSRLASPAFRLGPMLSCRECSDPTCAGHRAWWRRRQMTLPFRRFRQSRSPAA